MIEEDRIVNTHDLPDDAELQQTLRPKLLQDYIGQQQVREQMQIFLLLRHSIAKNPGSHFNLWSPWPGQNDFSPHYRARNARVISANIWPSIR
jgi:replication-associated recombination protein RarA